MSRTVSLFFNSRFDPRRLLGLSAFAGFFVLLAGWPFNSYMSRRSIRIHKGLLVARDKRMGVLSELIGAVCVHLCSILQPVVHRM